MFNRLKKYARSFRRQLRVYRLVYADPRTPRLSRWLLAGAAGYVVSPVQLIPNWIPVIGWLDDLVIVPPLVWLAMRLVPAAVVADSRQRALAERKS